MPHSFLDQFIQQPIVISYEIQENPKSYVAWFQDLPDLLIEVNEFSLITQTLYHFMYQYSEDYLRKFHFYYESLNRKAHLPYIIAVRSLSKEVFCQLFCFSISRESDFRAQLIHLIHDFPITMSHEEMMKHIHCFADSTCSINTQREHIQYSEEELLGMVRRLQATLLD